MARVSRHVSEHALLEWSPWHRSDHLVNEPATFEEQERGDSHDPIVLELPLVLVAVHLREHDPACVLPREFLDGRFDRLARGAPIRPEVDDHVRVLHDHAVEICIRDVNWMVLTHACFTCKRARYLSV